LKPDKVTEITTFANVLCRTTLTSFPACATTAYLAVTSSSSIPFLVQYLTSGLKSRYSKARSVIPSVQVVAK